MRVGFNSRPMSNSFFLRFASYVQNRLGTGFSPRRMRKPEKRVDQIKLQFLGTYVESGLSE